MFYRANRILANPKAMRALPLVKQLLLLMTASIPFRNQPFLNAKVAWPPRIGLGLI